jgi:hypothetical protein
MQDAADCQKRDLGSSKSRHNRDLRSQRIEAAHHASDYRIETNPEQSRKMKQI